MGETFCFLNIVIPGPGGNLFFGFIQGGEFAHRFSERIARFLLKNEEMSNSLKKIEQFAHSLIFGFGYSNLSDLLMVAHFW